MSSSFICSTSLVARRRGSHHHRADIHLPVLQERQGAADGPRSRTTSRHRRRWRPISGCAPAPPRPRAHVVRRTWSVRCLRVDHFVGLVAEHRAGAGLWSSRRRAVRRREQSSPEASESVDTLAGRVQHGVQLQGDRRPLVLACAERSRLPVSSFACSRLSASVRVSVRLVAAPEQEQVVHDVPSETLKSASVRLQWCEGRQFGDPRRTDEVQDPCFLVVQHLATQHQVVLPHLEDEQRLRPRLQGLPRQGSGWADHLDEAPQPPARYDVRGRAGEAKNRLAGSSGQGRAPCETATPDRAGWARGPRTDHRSCRCPGGVIARLPQLRWRRSTPVATDGS